MDSQPMHWYRSKIDWWLALLLCLPTVATIAVCTGLLLDGRYSELPWGIATGLFVVGIYFGLVFPMRYGLDETHLTVKFGRCTQRVPLVDVTEVYPTSNPLSSPALSLDRLYVKFGQGIFKAVMISPTDRDNFLNEFARKARLTREGDRLIRV